MKKIIFVTLIYVIAGILMYILLPFIHFLSGTSSSTVRLGVIIILAALTIIAIIEYFIYKNKLKRRYLYWIFSAIVFFVSSFKHAFWTEGNYHDCNIVSQNLFTGKYGAENCWGQSVVPEKYKDVVLIENSPEANIVGIIWDEDFSLDGFSKEDLYTLDIYYDSRRINKCKYITSANSSKSIFDVIHSICYKPCFYINYSTEQFYSNIFVSDFIVKDNSDTGISKDLTDNNEGNIESKDANPQINNYIDLGSIDAYFYSNSRNYSEKPETGWRLYAKIINNDTFYYLHKPEIGEDYMLVSKKSFAFDGKSFNGCAGTYWYLNIPAWPSSGDSSNSGRTEGSSQGDGNIHITHDPQPMQVWKDCMSCGGSTLCQVCGGLGYNGMFPDQECSACRGFKKCTICGGKGGHYEIEYH